MRGEADLAEVLKNGAERAVIGTAAIERPELVRTAVRRWGAERIAVGIDARGLRPATRGWTEEADVDLFELGQSLVESGVRTLIYTDIEQDGMLAGPNLATSVQLATRTGAEVIVSGGVSGMADVDAVIEAVRAGQGIAGVIIGKAIYEGRVDLRDAVARAMA